MTKMGEKVKKFLPLLATVTLCLVIAVTLLIVLPLLTPSNADNGTATPPDENKQQHQVGENPSIDDQLNGGDNNDSQDNTTPDQGSTTPTEPTQPDPVEPVNPKPTEPEITDPEPVDPTPTEPEEPDTTEPPVEEPVFELIDATSLRGTIWYYADNQMQLTFASGTKYEIARLANDNNGATVSTIIEQGTWCLTDSGITLTPSKSFPSAYGWDFTYAKNTLTTPGSDYAFVWVSPTGHSQS